MNDPDLSFECVEYLKLLDNFLVGEAILDRIEAREQMVALVQEMTR